MAQAKTQKQYNLTSGPILNRMLLVALPIMGTQLMQMFYNLTDMFWLGRLGADAVAASGTAGMYLWLSQAFMMVGRMGSEIGVAQSMGRGEKEAARRYSQTAVQLSVLLGLFFTVFLVALRVPLVDIFNIQERAVSEATELYLAIVALGIVPTFISSAIGGSFTGAGNTRVPFCINAIGLGLNMALDPLLIFKAGWGIAGAAVATTGAQVVVAVLFVLALRFGRQRPFAAYSFLAKMCRGDVLQVLQWSWPVALESMLFTVLSMVITRFNNSFGTAAMAVQRVGGQIESLSWLVGGGFASAVTAFVGQNYGAGRWGRIKRGMRVSTLVMLVYGVLVTLVLFFCGGALFRLFLEEEALVQLGSQYMRILALCQIVACLEYNSAGAFRGIGRTLPPSIVTTGGNLLRIPIVYALGARMGLEGIWWGIVIGAFIRSLWMFIWYLIMSRRLPDYDEQRA